MNAETLAAVLAATLIAALAVALIVVLERRRQRPHRPDRWAEMIRAENASRNPQEGEQTDETNT